MGPLALVLRQRVGLVLAIGDSHLLPLKRGRLGFSRFSGRVMLAVSVLGATGSGATNPNSVTGANDIFSSLLRTVKPKDTVVVMLGEIDAGFLVHLKAERQGEPVAKILDDMLARYIDFLGGVLQRTPRLIVIGPIPPTVENYTEWPGLNGARGKVLASQAVRMASTAAWGREVKIWCRAQGAQYLDLLEETLLADGSIREEFLNSDPADHHLHSDAMRRLLRARLGEFL